jgi:hypothetical protein
MQLCSADEWEEWIHTLRDCYKVNSDMYKECSRRIREVDLYYTPVTMKVSASIPCHKYEGGPIG